MGCMESEVYYLQEIELKLLLAGLGVREWHGLFSMNQAQDEAFGKKEAFHSVLAQLYQKGVVDWEGNTNSVSVSQPYAGMLSAMLEQKICADIQTQDRANPVRCCYISSMDVVVTEKGQQETDMLRMYQLSMPDWLWMIEDTARGMEDGQQLDLTFRNSESGREIQKIQIQQEGIRAVLVYCKNGKQICESCRADELRKKLYGLLENYRKVSGNG